MEEMEAEKGGYLISLVDIVVADGALAHLAVVFGSQQVGPVLFDGVGIDSLGVDSKIDESLLHDHSAIGKVGWILSQKPWYKIAIALILFELKFRLYECKNITISFDLASNPTFSDFNLILFPLYFNNSTRIFNFDSITITPNDKIELGSVNGDSRFVGYQYYFFCSLVRDINDGMGRMNFLYILHQ